MPSVPVWWSLVMICVCWFVHLHPYRPMTEVRVKEIRRESEMEEWSFGFIIWLKSYRRGGQVEVTPVLPCDEVDKLAWLSAGFSTSGGVLGRRSGLPDCTTVDKESRKNSPITYFNIIISNLRTVSQIIVVETTITVDMSQILPESASDSVLLKWLWSTNLESPPAVPVTCESGMGAPIVGALLSPPWPPPRLFFDGDGFTEDEAHQSGNDY